MPDQPPGKSRLHPSQQDSAGTTYSPALTPYAELATTSNFTFLHGASHPEELVERAAELGHRAACIADTNTLAGIVRAHVAAKRAGVPLAIGSRLTPEDCPPLVVYPTDRDSYGRLCRLLTRGKRRAPKGECHLSLHDVLEFGEGLLAVVEAPEVPDERTIQVIRGLRDAFGRDRLSLAAAFLYKGDDAERLDRIAVLSTETDTPVVATNHVLYHDPSRRQIQDIVTCIRRGTTIERAGLDLQANADRHLKPPDEMARLFAEHPRWVQRSADIAGRASAFNLDQLRYEYPTETCPPGMSPAAYLRQETYAGAHRRYGDNVPEITRRSLEHELALITELKYEAYFLTCYDIVNFARSQQILCQGRGGAANSAVCYCLGLTEVDPATHQLLFERFISRERAEPPDIDIDFEHERREEVLQYIYRKYGRDRAALTAEVISYRGRSSMREVAKAMGLPADCVDALAKSLDRWGDRATADRVRETGLNPEDPTIQKAIRLARELEGFPRHLSQHVGGFVFTQGPLDEYVPIENAAMDDRTVIEWDKDDIDAVGILKVDCLGLGMLTCIRKAIDLVVRDGETERRRDEGRQEVCDGWSSDVSGPGGLAEGNGAGQMCVPGDSNHADGRAVRIDFADETGSGGGPIEYRRGLRTAEHAGLHPVPAHRPGIAVRAFNPDRDRNPDQRTATTRGSARTPRRNRQSPPRLDPQHDPLTESPALCLSVSPSLRLFRQIANTPTDPSVYDMICHADTVGVFQIESRAQMSMLPRLKPREFYDLVIEVAIVRPGPIQGGMVHPYLRRREGKEPVEFPSLEVKHVLERTLGVPLFQEQAMKLAIVAAGFSPDQADGLRRSMADWKRKGNAIYRYGKQLIDGMLANGYERSFAERCFEQIKGFSEYGFPESHAASFAILVYVSCWLKRHHPAAFAAALINSQPMGFYQPAQIVRDAEEHGVEVRGVDVNRSLWDCGLEEETKRRGDGETERGREMWGVGGPAIRLGMRMVKGLKEDDGRAIAEAVRTHGTFDTVESLWRASGVGVRALRQLAKADAFGSMGLDRQRALWQVRPLRDAPMPLFEQSDTTDDAGLDRLPVTTPAARVLGDYNAVGLSLKAHPVSFIREKLDAKHTIPCGRLRDEKLCPGKSRVAVAGLVLCRQRPGTASGVVFITLEDETGIANLIIWSDIFEKHRRAIRLSTLLLARGIVERQGEVVHIHASHLESMDHVMPSLAAASRDFH